jgi:cytoskeletal protein RodZ
MREVPLREIADVTKISLRYLEALEQERFDVLPAPVFAKGFLREYARYVGLDPDEVVNSFLIATGEAVESDGEEGEEESEDGKGGGKTALFVILALAVIVAVVLVVALVSRARDEQPIRTSPIAAPLTLTEESGVEEAEPQSEVAAMPLTVIIDFTEDCWMEAVVDDDRSISELRVQGESMRLEAREKVLLTLGNPSGVRVEVNGRPYSFPFTENRIVRNLEIDVPLAESLTKGAD